MGLAPTAVDHFAESASTLTDGVPVFGNAAICVDSLCTTGRASINFLRTNCDGENSGNE